MSKKRLLYVGFALAGMAVLAVLARGHYTPGPGTVVTATPSSGNPAGGHGATSKAGNAPGRGAAGPGGPVAVEAMTVSASPLRDEIHAVGSLRSAESVMLRPETSGRIAAIRFTDGQQVSKGQVLVQFDATLSEAEVRQARAELDLARSKLERTRDLAERKFLSLNALEEASANVHILEARHALARARLDRLSLRAPFSGRVGMRNISVGDYVREGTDLVSIDDTSTLKVDFRVPEHLAARLRVGQGLNIEADALPGRSFPARVEAIDPQVDAAGRSLLLRGRIANAQGALKPGMFVRVRLLVADKPAALMIPEEAVFAAQGRTQVFRIVDGKAVRGEVVTGVRQDGKVEITSGVKAGDVIVTSGQMKLRGDQLPVRVLPAAPRTAEGGAVEAAAGARPGTASDATPAPAAEASAPSTAAASAQPAGKPRND